jgi:hypothetical protein
MCNNHKDNAVLFAKQNKTEQLCCVGVVLYMAVRICCKHNGAVLPVSAALVGRGVDGADAMA